MAEQRWKKFVTDLRSSGFESPYLDRLHARITSLEQAHAGVETEILQEIASALGRSEDKLNLALLELDVLDRRITALEARPGARPGTRPEASRELAGLIDAFNAGRQEALDRRRDLQIHREAVGFRRNEVLAQLYPVPPARAPKT